MKRTLVIFALILSWACKEEKQETAINTYDESIEIADQQTHENPRMRFKLLRSAFRDNKVWSVYDDALENFSEKRYDELYPLVMEQDIPAIQRAVIAGKLTYEELTLFYIYRIRKFESDNGLSLNGLIALNPEALTEAKLLDKETDRSGREFTVFGMPILLKDNIDTKEMPTTAGAIVLDKNQTDEDAFIVTKLKEQGAIILGKANLSEWAYYFCSGCPVGYSAVGGQTLNPYGRKKFETGGSSSGSAVTVAVNYAVAAIGTETAGSIVSPASQNSVVGLKPTVGLLSRTGIVPISGTLDTPGPICRNITDIAILLNAMKGEDPADKASANRDGMDDDYLTVLNDTGLEGKRLGALKGLMENDSLYAQTIEKLKLAGAEVVVVEPPKVSLSNFLTLLNIDMKHDLPAYLSAYASHQIKVRSVKDIIEYNEQDSLLRMPYGQGLFEGLMADTTSLEDLEKMKTVLRENGRKFFDTPLDKYELDAILSVNNYHAAYAAVANYPELTLPMGYTEAGEPVGLTLISKGFTEKELLQLGYAIEQLTKVRKQPENYR